MTPPALALAGVVVFLASLGATRWLIPRLRQHGPVVLPDAGSNHAQPVPVGGGLAVMAVALVALALLPDASVPWPILMQAGALAGLSWLDDCRGVPIPRRLLAQALAVLTGMALLPDDARLCQGLLPVPLDRGLTLVAWLWFVNLFNFMDGIDGIAGVQSVTLAAGIGLVACLLPNAAALALAGVVLGAAAAGFLVWNWRPARIYLGDVGSIGLGYLFGWLLLDLAVRGAWLPTLLLPLVALADTTWTLLARLLHGERFWQSHRTHAYQRAAQAWGNDARVCRAVLAVDLVLVALAGLAVAVPQTGLATLLAGAVMVAGLLRRFHRAKPSASGAPCLQPSLAQRL